MPQIKLGFKFAGLLMPSHSRTGIILVEIYQMGLNIKNAEVKRLAAEVAGLAYETKTELSEDH